MNKCSYTLSHAGDKYCREQPSVWARYSADYKAQYLQLWFWIQIYMNAISPLRFSGFSHAPIRISFGVKQIQCFDQHPLEARQMQFHILVVHVHLLRRIPPYTIHRLWIPQIRMILGILIIQRAFLRQDLVLKVFDCIHLRGRPSEESPRSPLYSQRDNLHKNAPRWKKQKMCQCRAMDSHENIAGIDNFIHVFQLGVHIWRQNHDPETQFLCYLNDFSLVQENSGSLAGN